MFILLNWYESIFIEYLFKYIINLTKFNESNSLISSNLVFLFILTFFDNLDFIKLFIIFLNQWALNLISFLSILPDLPNGNFSKGIIFDGII